MTSYEACDTYGLRLAGISEDSIGFTGHIGDCLKFGLALGMEVKELKGAARDTSNGLFYSEHGTEDNFAYCEFKQGGFIIRLVSANNGFLGIPMSVWMSSEKTKES